ncbi:MAG: tRNA glutamyl-Q(34) synthetase GluQRS [Marinosulfonomonas sp.]
MTRLPDMSATQFCTRFAPSPTGPLHLGHAYSALLAHDMAQAQGGRFLLRIEDIDQSRARPKWEEMIYDDLRWLGLSWEQPVLRQSDRQAAYDAALDDLWGRGLLYVCSCTRRDIAAAIEAPQEGASPATGPDGLIYPGTCRPDIAPLGPRPRDQALRLNMQRALKFCGPSLAFVETGPIRQGPVQMTADEIQSGIGDIVLARRDMGTSYHLSVVLDDAFQEITHVVRGADLSEATIIHVLLQRLLDLPTPVYHHHRLIRDDQGKRLAKRDDARSLQQYRQAGLQPADIRKMVFL